MLRVTAEHLEDNNQFYLLGQDEPNGPFILEKSKWTRRFSYRRPQSNERWKICGSERVYLTWRDACIKMAEQLEDEVGKLTQKAKLLRSKAEE